MTRFKSLDYELCVHPHSTIIFPEIELNFYYKFDMTNFVLSSAQFSYNCHRVFSILTARGELDENHAAHFEYALFIPFSDIIFIDYELGQERKK